LSDFLSRLAHRSQGAARLAAPRQRSRFEQEAPPPVRPEPAAGDAIAAGAAPDPLPPASPAAEGRPAPSRPAPTIVRPEAAVPPARPAAPARPTAAVRPRAARPYEPPAPGKSPERQGERPDLSPGVRERSAEGRPEPRQIRERRAAEPAPPSPAEEAAAPPRDNPPLAASRPAAAAHETATFRLPGQPAPSRADLAAGPMRELAPSAALLPRLRPAENPAAEKRRPSPDAGEGHGREIPPALPAPTAVAALPAAAAPAPRRRPEDAAAGEPVIEVKIGRLEVKAAPPPAPPAAPRRPGASRLSLRDYLRAHNERRR
jgi:hypothetical protein